MADDALYIPGSRRPHVIHVSQAATLHDLDSYLTRVEPRIQGGASNIAFRISSELRDSLDGETGRDVRDTLLRRVETRMPLHTVSLGGTGFVASTITAEALVAASPSVVHDLRKADLSSLVREHENACYYRGTRTHHYVAPSGQHCDAFFRLGDVIRSSDALDRLSFWLAPTIHGSSAILVDTWSIALVVVRALQMLGLNTPFECLTSHPKHDKLGATGVIGTLKSLMTDAEHGRLTCILSVSSSGAYEHAVSAICQGLELNDVAFLAIYKLAGVASDAESLCDLELCPNNYPPINCQLCSEGSTPVTIHPSLYYLKDYPENPIALKRELFFSPARRAPRSGGCASDLQPTSAHDADTFVARYHHLTNVFGVHRGDRLGNHHAFHVSVASLLTDPPFMKEFEARLSTLPNKPDVVIAPMDETALAMARVAERLFGSATVAINANRNIDHLSNAQRQLLDGGKHYLVLDDVLISGRRLSEHNAFLRERTIPPRSISFLVGVARPPSEAEWRSVKIALTVGVDWPASLECVETMYLPHWNSGRCPWCRELAFWSRLAGDLPEKPAWLDERISRLTEGSSESAALWFLPGVETRSLGHGSPVGPGGLSAIASLFSFASALQKLRRDNTKPLKPGFPTFNVYGRMNLDNYSEALLRAIALRAVLPDEWGTAQSQDVTSTLAAAIRGEGGEVLLGEALLAIARGSLDRRLFGEVESLVESQWPEIRAMLRRAWSATE